MLSLVLESFLLLNSFGAVGVVMFVAFYEASVCAYVHLTLSCSAQRCRAGGGWTELQETMVSLLTC